MNENVFNLKRVYYYNAVICDDSKKIINTKKRGDFLDFLTYIQTDVFLMIIRIISTEFECVRCENGLNVSK